MKQKLHKRLEQGTQVPKVASNDISTVFICANQPVYRWILSRFESAFDIKIGFGIEVTLTSNFNKMPLFLANLAMSSYFLALCYVLVTAMTVNKYLEVRRVLKRHEHTTWSTVQLLVLSVALGSFFRSATFSTLCILDSQATADLPTGISSNNPWVHDAPPPTHGREDANGASLDTTGSHAQVELDFYNKVVAVLFNLPDFLFVSSYLLLVLVWAETFQSVGGQ